VTSESVLRAILTPVSNAIDYGSVAANHVNLISDALPFGRLWYAEPNAVSNAIAYALHYSRSHPVVISVYDAAGNVIRTHKHTGDFKEP
jgi:hypothetical protein